MLNVYINRCDSAKSINMFKLFFNNLFQLCCSCIVCIINKKIIRRRWWCEDKLSLNHLCGICLLLIYIRYTILYMYIENEHIYYYRSTRCA